MPLLEGLEVFRSGIHGYGVRTTRAFKAGDTVVWGDGVMYREHEEFDDTYCLITPDYLGDPDDDDGPAMYFDLICQTRWINHGCDPNTYVDTDWDEDEEVIVAWWTATRDIEAGEELTYDYAFSGHLAEPCACGVTTCRGVIVNPDELHLVPEELSHLVRRPAA